MSKNLFIRMCQKFSEFSEAQKFSRVPLKRNPVSVADDNRHDDLIDQIIC